jgi:pimeloyl-ACP methyl ester carboxylesterase
MKFVAHNDYEVTTGGAGADYVVLIHGLWSKSDMLETIAESLSAKGYRVINVQYPTTEGDIDSITKDFIAPALHGLDEAATVHFVTHSMGSVVLRHYLANNSLPQLGKVVFVAPPSHGSPLADLSLTELLSSSLGVAVLQLGTDNDSFVNSLPEPDYPCYVLAGDNAYPILSWLIPGEDDGLVPLDTIALDTCKFKLITDTAHKSILDDERTLLVIGNFLRE